MANFGQGRFAGIPPIVKNIIIINVLIVFIQFVLGQKGIDLGDYLGLHYWQSPKFRWWQFLTHIFMHGSPNDLGMTISHIFFNMYGLFMFGSILENLWGAKRFIIFYLICGLGAGFCYLGVLGFEFSSFHSSFLHFQEHPTFVEYGQFVRHNRLADNPFFAQILSFWGQNNDCTDCAGEAIKVINEYYSKIINIGMVGASGAIFGILFAFGYLFPNTELYIMFIPVPIKAKWAVAGYAAIELFSGIGRFQGDNTAHFAHLGGMLFAFIILRFWHKKDRNNFY